MDGIIKDRESIPRANDMANDDSESKFWRAENLLVGIDDGGVVGGDVVSVKETASCELIRSGWFGFEDVHVELVECGIFFGDSTVPNSQFC